jgi:polar amino acid transport system substrate-binding protein
MRAIHPLVAVWALAAGSAAADCDLLHTVAAGDTVFTIAQQYYADHTQWSVIYYGNQESLGGTLFDLTPGLQLRVPCIGGDDAAADATPLRLDGGAEMVLLTGSDFAPFTDRDWVGQGMVTELVNAALEEMPQPVTYEIAWEDDWARHPPLMLEQRQADMGFPWLKPDCTETPGEGHCADFLFSDPLMEVLVMLFVRSDATFRFERDTDLHGRTLCRPEGYFRHDLDRADRQWLTNGLVTLVEADSPDACFELLMLGQVDAVSVNEFLGLTKISELGLSGLVRPMDRPVSIEGLHVVIPKRHHRATAFLYRFNAGLASLRASARYDEIVSRHLGLFWEQVR